MLLAVDVGNTLSVLGVVAQDSFAHTWRLPTDHKQTADALRANLHGLFSLAGIETRLVNGVVLATVVPALRRLWCDLARQMFGVEALCVNAEAAAGLFECKGYDSAVLGADRIADAVAARALYGSPVIVLDFGTATNMEVIDEHGCFVGGVIAPGVETSMKALFSNAALLPEVELADPRTALGANTTQAIQIGIVYGEVDRVDGLVQRIWDQLGYQTPVVATGGYCETMGALCRTVTDVDSRLTLRGLQMIYEAQANQ